MKLEVKNFSGTINGKQYRIIVDSDNIWLDASFKIRSDITGKYYAEKVACETLLNQPYETALRKALNSLEEQTGLILLKPELKQIA